MVEALETDRLFQLFETVATARRLEEYQAQKMLSRIEYVLENQNAKRPKKYPEYLALRKLKESALDLIFGKPKGQEKEGSGKEIPRHLLEKPAPEDESSDVIAQEWGDFESKDVFREARRLKRKERDG